MTRRRCSSENEVASPVVPSTLSPSQPVSRRKRASAVERAQSGSPLSSTAVATAAITPCIVLVCAVLIAVLLPLSFCTRRRSSKACGIGYGNSHGDGLRCDHSWCRRGGLRAGEPALSAVGDACPRARSGPRSVAGRRAGRRARFLSAVLLQRQLLLARAEGALAAKG